MAVLYGRQAAVDGLWSTRHTAPMGQRKGLHAQAHAQQRCVGSVAKDIQAHTCGSDADGGMFSHNCCQHTDVGGVAGGARAWGDDDVIHVG